MILYWDPEKYLLKLHTEFHVQLQFSYIVAK